MLKYAARPAYGALLPSLKLRHMIIGIDLGTTNSLCAVWRDGAAQLIPNALGLTLTPSVVGLDDENRVLVGLPARERLITHPQHTAAVFKRYMGSAQHTTLGSQRFRPEELSALVLQSLKADAERFLGEPVTEAVITVPAYFSDAQRKATRQAGELAGLQVAGLLNEPTAAALAYGLHQRDAESTFLVFDLGGGTFDVSILELFDGVMEVRASAGDNFLGGEDFATALIEGFLQQHPTLEPSLDPVDPQSGRLRQLLRKEAERVKRTLSEQPSVEFSLVWQDQSYRWNVTEAEYARRVEPCCCVCASRWSVPCGTVGSSWPTSTKSCWRVAPHACRWCGAWWHACLAACLPCISTPMRSSRWVRQCKPDSSRAMRHCAKWS